MRGQFLPLWRDPAFHQTLASSYELQFFAKSVTRHTQGDHLNQVVNCAHAHLGLEDFLSAMDCWEGNVEAWVPIPGTQRFKQQNVDIDGVMSRCMPSQSVGLLKECSQSENETITLNLLVQSHIPPSFNEVPW